jgi:hypothetical protein
VAEPGTQLKPILERLPILVVGGVFNGDGVVTLSGLTTLLRFALPLLWYIFKLWGGGGSKIYLATSSYRQQLV